MTSDGIEKEDWDEIESLAFSIVESSRTEDEILKSIYTDKFHDTLDELVLKYGRLPSILATKGDFARDFEDPVIFWREAYSAAQRIKDPKNQLLIASSLLDHFVDLEKYGEAREWLKRGESLLLEISDEDESKHFAELRREIERMDGPR